MAINTQPAPARMNLYALADQALGRYVADRQGRPAMLSPGEAQLRRQAALLNAPQGAAEASVGAYGAGVAPSSEAINDDEARWRAWWGMAPAITYTQLHGLGAAGEASFALAQKLKKLGAGSGGGGGRGGGGGGGAAAPPSQGAWQPPHFSTPGTLNDDLSDFPTRDYQYPTNPRYTAYQQRNKGKTRVAPVASAPRAF